MGSVNFRVKVLLRRNFETKESDPIKKIVKWCLIVIGILSILCIGLIVSLEVSVKFFSGVRVEVINRDSLAMQHVSVEVTGASYQIGDVPPDSGKSVKVRPRGESSVTVKYSDNSGKHRVYIDTYMENGYFGYIKVQIKEGKILHVEQDIQLLPSFMRPVLKVLSLL